MEWDNRFSGIDDFFENYRTFWNIDKEIAVFGAGNNFDILYPFAKDFINISYIIDNDISKQGAYKLEYEIAGIDRLINDPQKPQIVIASRDDHGTISSIISDLEKRGYARHRDFTSLYRLTQYYNLKKKNRFYLYSGTVIITSNCTLKCAGCYMGTPYRKKTVNRPVEDIKKDIDNFFSLVDTVSIFNISGGDALTHPHLTEIVRYIGETYRYRIIQPGVLTTGVLPPKKDLLAACREFDVTLGVSDYSEGVNTEKYTEQLHRFMDTVNTEGCRLSVSKEWSKNEWIDIGEPTFIRNRTQEETKEQFRKCGIQFTNYFHNGRLFHCPLSAGFDIGHGLTASDDEYIDLNRFSAKDSFSNTDKIKEMILFDMGFISKGYIEACKFCDGMGIANPNRVIPGTQLRK